jgi:hypothetical protein
MTLYTDKKIKAIGDEFKAMNVVNNIYCAVKEYNKFYRLRVPLTCEVHYKGFKAFVQAKPPYERNLLVGPDNYSGMYQSYSELNNDLMILSKKLRAKPHLFAWYHIS